MQDQLRRGLYEAPLMNVFRQAARERDAERAADDIENPDEREETLARRNAPRHRAASNSELREYLLRDLSSLLNTVRVDATLDLSGHPQVRRSVLNFGIQDLSPLTSDNVDPAEIMENLRKTLRAHEPRLIGEEIEITQVERNDSFRSRMSFQIGAVMVAEPYDIPLEFEAEIDLGAAKVALTKLAVDK